MASIAADVSAQDALRGKRIYLDAAQLLDAGISCVDCHGAYPPGGFGIGRAADQSAIVANALNSIPQMALLRAKLSPTEIADVAAFLGNPTVASPTLRIIARSPDGVDSIDRITFGSASVGRTTGEARVTLMNSGTLPLQINSAPKVVGSNASDYVVTGSTCGASQGLDPGRSCEVRVVFKPGTGAAGLRTAAMQVDHDWVRSPAAVALLGTVDAVALQPR